MSLIIAEIGTSHEGSKEKAKQLVDTAVEAGCDCVKFQWVYADEILHPKTGFVELPTGRIPLYERFRQLECPSSFYKSMMDYAHQKGVKFCCSPFGLRSMEELLALNPDIVKIASPELNHAPMLEYLASYRKNQISRGENPVPVIISSGVSKLEDIEKALIILGKDNVSLLHCITSYPAPEEEYNLRLIKTFSEKWGIDCGVSDHSLDPVLVPVLSVACGGKIIEKHITLSRETLGLDDPVALEGEMFALMVHCVHQAEAALNHYGPEGPAYIINQLKNNEENSERVEKILGDGIKRLAPSEERNYTRTNRSIHFLRNMKAGEKISASDVAVLRTEKVLSVGMSPFDLNKVIGAVLKNDVEDGAGVQENDLL